MSAALRCPNCRKPALAEYRPFCSKRCADVDLARWLRADYVLPGRDGEALEQPDPDAGGDTPHDDT
ncbi:MAG: DNA gyrase inhibitor YacG [Pararhodobacter sp.]